MLPTEPLGLKANRIGCGPPCKARIFGRAWAGLIAVSLQSPPCGVCFPNIAWGAALGEQLVGLPQHCGDEGLDTCLKLALPPSFPKAICLMESKLLCKPALCWARSSFHLSAHTVFHLVPLKGADDRPVPLLCLRVTHGSFRVSPLMASRWALASEISRLPGLPDCDAPRLLPETGFPSSSPELKARR